ncbi:Vacuolar protein sorting-associated protein 13 [Eumeta japonica]|uniref:Vacuolar protein sorting-associated protein 13 n=1 Tax=Eumeta variegata TaxID=151549 RepID=A0A4C1WBR0_EUMVA|nr:Vacuolar protein sorting-associated protein 13 [Eumeta japonica]
MVFEAIVVDVLNRFLGDYVENLNRSQLKLGIWGGDVVLENLVLKQNALEELNIPVQTVYGHLGKLVLKIPWKNLYGASVEASVERLFLIINPSAEVKYDPEKEDKLLLASKQAELARVEEAKKKEAQKDLNKLDETFVEKLVTQIIKNVQLKIQDIHIRYEDSITNPKAPFSFGITLHNLSVHTTDENWKQCVIQQAVTKIFKILSLEGLAVYWNPITDLYSKLTPADIKERLQKEIASKTHKPDFYNYALGPINATAKLKLNPKPENDTPKFSIPKIILTLHMEQLSVTLNKLQYQDMMMLADSMDRMNKGAPYRKYRPDLKYYRGHYKEWWHFAYKCVLEEEVRRRHRNWDWNHMHSHRQLCRDYAKVYQYKLSNKGKMSTEQKNILEEGERHLTLLNLVIIRQQIELEVERLGKLQEEAKKSRGWLGGWFGGKTSKDDELSEGTAIMKQFENAMTPEEKAKLYRAIDYQENTAPLHLPTEYIAVHGLFHLDRLQVGVYDKTQVLRACVDNVEVALKQRPSANALRVDVQMQKFSVLGVKQGESEPELVISKEVTKDVNLLNVVFETNPLDGLCDQRVQVSARPLQIIYDAQTVIEIVNVFKPPTESTALTTLQAAAENKLSDLKEKSSLGMQYAVNQHMFIDIDIVIASSYIIVPDKGVYKGNESCVVVKLGAITVKTAPRSTKALDIRKLVAEGLADEDILREITEHAYDKMSLELTEMQILIAKANEDWTSVITSHEPSYLHLLQPSNLVIQIHKCLIMDDPRLPKVKVLGELQKIAISVAEDRLLTLFEILVGIPLPGSDAPAPIKASDYKTPHSGRNIDEDIRAVHDLMPTDSKSSSLSLFKYLDPAEKQKREASKGNKKDDEQTVQLTEVEAFFVIKELILSVNRKKDDVYHKMLVFSLTSLELTATQRTFTLETVLRLGAMYLDHHRPTFDIIKVIHTPDLGSSSSDQYLFTITYLNVNKKCPDFRSHYGSVEQLIKLDFKVLSVMLHQEGLKQVMLIANEYQKRLQTIQASVDRVADAGPLPTIAEEDEVVATKSKTVAKATKKKQVDSIHLKVNVKIDAVEIQFATDKRPLSNVQLQGMQSSVIMKSSYMQIGCSIASIDVEDLNPVSIHKKEFLNNFQAAQQAIIDASAVAADAARANVQNAYQNSTKVLLKVQLDAPLIIIPENSKSLDAMLVDLGQMKINNNFVDLQVQGLSNKVTVDELTLGLENVKLSCVQLNSCDDGYSGERNLLKPTSFTLLVKRSLSTWYEPLPDLDISGRLKAIQILVGQRDYKSIMKILNQNLQEGQQKPEPKQLQTVQSGPSKPSVKSQTSSKTQIKTSLQTQTSVPEMPAKPRVTMNFAFTMDSFVIDLMSHVTSKTSEEGKDSDLARFCLALLAVKGRMLSDSSMQTSVLLVDCTLDDTRPARGDKITRYLERRPMIGNKDMNGAKSSDDRSMIDITYSMKNSDAFVDIRVCSFNLILAMDFLNKVIEFVTTGVSEEAPDSVPVIKSQPEKSSDSLQVKSKISVSTPAPEVEQKSSMMTVNLKIEQPDIILVESLEEKKCDCLVLNMEVSFKLRKTLERMAANGSISGLQMIIRTLGEVSDSSPRYLLSPSQVNLMLSAPPDSGMHIDVEMSDIYINVSPRTARRCSDAAVLQWEVISIDTPPSLCGNAVIARTCTPNAERGTEIVFAITHCNYATWPPRHL